MLVAPSLPAAVDFSVAWRDIEKWRRRQARWPRFRATRAFLPLWYPYDEARIAVTRLICRRESRRLRRAHLWLAALHGPFFYDQHQVRMLDQCPGASESELGEYIPVTVSVFSLDVSFRWGLFNLKLQHSRGIFVTWLVASLDVFCCPRRQLNEITGLRSLRQTRADDRESTDNGARDLLSALFARLRHVLSVLFTLFAASGALDELLAHVIVR